jgi:hypothetical protein
VLRINITLNKRQFAHLPVDSPINPSTQTGSISEFPAQIYSQATGRALKVVNQNNSAWEISGRWLVDGRMRL